MHDTCCLNYFLFSLMFEKLQIFIYFFNIINSTFNDRDTNCYYYTSSIQTTHHQNKKKKFLKISPLFRIPFHLVLNNRNHRRGRENRKNLRSTQWRIKSGGAPGQLTGETVSSFAARRCFDSVISTSARVKSCVPFVHKSRSKERVKLWEIRFSNLSDSHKGTTVSLRQSWKHFYQRKKKKNKGRETTIRWINRQEREKKKKRGKLPFSSLF